MSEIEYTADMTKLIVTCEHGGNLIPEKFRHYLTDLQFNKSHRAYDAGALSLYRTIEKEYSDYGRCSLISRLLIDFNRSVNNRNIFSGFSKTMPANHKNDLMSIYIDYRENVINYIKSNISKDIRVIHISVHTFVPQLNGRERNTDIGILYDPKKREEKSLASRWKAILKDINPEYKVRFNYPYLGISDGFTTYLRKLFEQNYIGIELEVNQKHVINNRILSNAKGLILRSIGQLVRSYKHY